MNILKESEKSRIKFIITEIKDYLIKNYKLKQIVSNERFTIFEDKDNGCQFSLNMSTNKIEIKCTNYNGDFKVPELIIYNSENLNSIKKKISKWWEEYYISEIVPWFTIGEEN